MQMIQTVINQSIRWTPKTKFLLPSLYKSEGLPLFGKWFDFLTILSLSKERGKGRFFETYISIIYGLLRDF